jgi:hypothetical protein
VAARLDITALDITALAPSATAATLKTLFAMINSPLVQPTPGNAGSGQGFSARP